METCCGVISLEVGSAFSAISLLIVSIAELILQQLFDMEDVERATIVIHVFVLFIGAVSLLTGVLLADEICTFIFVIFWFGTMLSELAAILVISTSEIRSVYYKIFGGFYFTILFVFRLTNTVRLHARRRARLSESRLGLGPRLLQSCSKPLQGRKLFKFFNHAVHTYMMLIAFCLGVKLWHDHHQVIIRAVRGHSITLRGQHVI